METIERLFMLLSMKDIPRKFRHWFKPEASRLPKSQEFAASTSGRLSVGAAYASLRTHRLSFAATIAHAKEVMYVDFWYPFSMAAHHGLFLSENWEAARAGWYIGLICQAAVAPERYNSPYMQVWRQVMQGVILGDPDAAALAKLRKYRVQAMERDSPTTLSYFTDLSALAIHFMADPATHLREASSIQVLLERELERLRENKGRGLFIEPWALNILWTSMLNEPRREIKRKVRQLSDLLEAETVQNGARAPMREACGALRIWLEKRESSRDPVAARSVYKKMLNSTAMSFDGLDPPSDLTVPFPVPEWLFAMAMRLDLEGPTPSNREFVRNFKPLPFAFDFLKERREEFDDGSEPDPLPPPEEVLEFLEKEGLIDGRWREG